MKKDLQFHDLANIYPLNTELIEELADDIRERGQIDAISLFDGKIIDGRTRYKACLLASVEPVCEDVYPEDPVAFVLSKNSKRRHLKASQLATVADKARAYYDEQAKERQKASGGDKKSDNAKIGSGKKTITDKQTARDAVGAAVGVSGSLVDKAKKVREKGVPELYKAVEEGRMSVSRAAELTEEAEATQRHEAESAEFSGGRFRSKPQKKKPKKAAKPTDGRGLQYATEAVNCLKKIRKTDPQRNRAFQFVTDYIKANK